MYLVKRKYIFNSHYIKPECLNYDLLYQSHSTLNTSRGILALPSSTPKPNRTTSFKIVCEASLLIVYACIYKESLSLLPFYANIIFIGGFYWRNCIGCHKNERLSVLGIGAEENSKGES